MSEKEPRPLTEKEQSELNVLVANIIFNRYRHPTIKEMNRADELTRIKWAHELYQEKKINPTK